MSASEKLLVLGPRPNPGDVIGGTKVSFEAQLEAFRASGRFELEVVDTARPLRDRGRAARGLLHLSALGRAFEALRRTRARRALWNASPGALLSAGPALAWIAKRRGLALGVRVFGGDLDLFLERAPAWRRRLARASVLAPELLLLQTKALCERFEGARWLPTTRALEPVPLERSSCRRFLWIGQLRPEKGALRAAEALASLPADARLDLYGPAVPGFDPARLEGAPRVRWHGSIEPARVPAVLARADALLFPSTYPGEGLPGVVVEALQIGRPVIATRWRSLPELVEHERSGLLVDPHATDALPAAMESLAKDAGRFQALARGAAERGAEFRTADWHARLEAWLAAMHREEATACAA